ncbi:antagonist of KipI [Halobacillus dabanensis]|uniref:Antagonist of KipI n=1 Tax=Halobacillus dabanensis TaxID=240302 RepID=A0A1I3XMW1_HALDA|nr:biotin-dependent carboxyltransferase family protein [Halobacillus dabanensis]SFK20894.1 antagonist of KipI [Halobacillus dabanensis]
MISVLKAGLMTTIQDQGRYGNQKNGVIASGAMDQDSHRIANQLVGNTTNVPTMEITLMGPVLEFQQDTCIAICGGHLTPMIDGEPVSMWKPVYIKKGTELRFGQPKSGFRSYLAIAGGFEVPTVMGSASTYIRAGIGGYKGRPLEKGDTLTIGRQSEDSQYLMKKLTPSDPKERLREAPWFVDSSFTDYIGAKHPIRVMPGREYDLFETQSQYDFFHTPYTIDSKSDRMGYRLTGSTLKLKEKKDILSEAVAFGTVQVPPEGNPILLLADRQTTGGYPKIGQVASVDLPRIAQMRPGESLTFEQISHDAAQRLLLHHETKLKQLQRGIKTKYL